MSRLAKTAAFGGVGYLGGLLLERGLESITGLDFVDGLFAVAGSVLGAMYVNRDMVEAASRNMRVMFGKDPIYITEGEWKQFKSKYPETAKWLEKALEV
jgi:hypothetical protein